MQQLRTKGDSDKKRKHDGTKPSGAGGTRGWGGMRSANEKMDQRRETNQHQKKERTKVHIKKWRNEKCERKERGEKIRTQKLQNKRYG